MRGLISLLLIFGLIGVAEAASDTLKRIKDRGEIRIGYREATEPLSFTGPDGRASGYSVDLCERIAETVRTELKLSELKVTHVSVSLAERFDAVASGKIDILCAATTVTLSRMDKVDFSLMTFVTGGSVMSRASAPVALTSNLAGKKVGVVTGSSTEVALNAHLKETFVEAELIGAESLEAANAMLNAGKVDAVAGDQIGLIGQMAVSEDPRQFALAEDLFSYEPYALVIARGDTDFRNIADRVLARIYRTGQFKQLYDKWFGRMGLRPPPILQAMYKMNSLPE